MVEAQLRALEAELLAEGVASFDTKPTEPALAVHWVACRTIFLRGFPLEGPAVSFQKGNALLSSGWDILNTLDPITVTIQDDADWYHFPEIGVAYQKMTSEENYFAVAFSTRFCKWGVGFGNGQKGRESAARLALAVAIASGNSQLDAFKHQFPGFASLCVAPTAGGASEHVSRGFAEGRGSKVVHDLAKRPAAEETTSAQVQPPRIHWVSLREDSKMVQQGWPAQLPAIIHDKSQQPFFSMAASLLDDVLGKHYANFYHEADWKKSPEMSDALKLAMGPKASEYSFCVATCNELNQWAYGLAWGKKPMEVAAKLSLAFQIARTSGRLEELMREYPEFQQLVQAASADSDSMATKRPRLGDCVIDLRPEQQNCKQWASS